MKWVARVLAGLVALVVLGVLGLLIAGKRQNHGRIAREITIERPAAQVFRWITTEDLLKKWVGGLVELRPELPSPGGVEVGRKFHIAEIFNGERTEMEMEVLKFERDGDVVIRVTSVGDLNNGFVETAEYRLIEASGKTQLRIEGQTDYFGYIPRLFEPFITRGARKKLKADMIRLKSLVEAESSLSEDSAAPDARQSAAQIDRLKFYVGDWDYSEVYEKSALFPNGGHNSGSWTGQLGPRGFSVMNAFVSHGTGDNYEGMEVMTWNVKDNLYMDHAIWYDSADQWVFKGNFQGDILAFHGEFNYLGKRVRFRSEIRPLANGGFTLTEYAGVNGAPEERILVGTAKPR